VSGKKREPITKQKGSSNAKDPYGEKRRNSIHPYFRENQKKEGGEGKIDIS